MPKIHTFLTYIDQAEAAAAHYVSVFPHSRITHISRYGEAGPGPAGSVMVVEFELDGQPFIALNGGPHFKFTDGISLLVDCETQEEIDYYWDRLSEGGEPGHCGWLTDRFGVSWQINVPLIVSWLKDPDPAVSQRVMKAVLAMRKPDLAALAAAHRGDQTIPN